MSTKKFILALWVAMSVFILCGTVSADTEDLPHVVLGNLLKIEGGNRNVMIAEIKANQKPKPIQGFDTKETFRRVYEEDAKISDFYKPNAEQRAELEALSLLAGEDVLKGGKEASFKDILPYRNFTEATWADMKYRLHQFGTGKGTAVALSGKPVRRPAKANAVPPKTSILNSNSPLIISTLDNSITLGFYDVDMVYRCEVKLINNKGKVLGLLKEKNFRESNQPVTINLPDGRDTYYLEFSQYGGEYYYVLLDIEPDPTKPQEDKSITSAIESMRKAGEKGEKLADSYMASKGITDMAQFSEADKQGFAEEFARQEMKNTPASQQTHALSEMEVISQYMKERGIASMAMLTEKDSKELQRRIMKNAALSWPSEYRAIVDSYMKQHNISGYEYLTEKDMKAVEKLVKQKADSQKKSAGKAKSRKSK